MEKIKNTSELKRNLEVNREKLLELMKAYDLAVLGYQVQEQRCNDIYDKVLSEHEFYASIDFARAGINIGDRITEEKFDFLLSDEDFDRLTTLAAPIFLEECITDENGYFMEDWVSTKVSTMNALADFIIDDILPTDMREEFKQVRRHVVYEEKLINLMRSVS